MTPPKNSLLYRIVIIFIFLLLTATIWNITSKRSSPPQDLIGVLRVEPKQLNSFNLIDQNGRLVNEQIFKNK